MFTSARIKLTAWYLLIIMSICLLFSVIIYSITTREFSEGYQRIYNQYRKERPDLGADMDSFNPDPAIIAASQKQVENNLIYLNMIVLGVSAGTGYFLAGKTLKPIKEIMEEQNQFVSDASHELRTPLTSLRTAIEVSLRDKKMDVEEARGVLQSNLEDVVGLQSLTNNLLALAKNYENNVKVVKEQTMISKLVQEAIEQVQYQAGEKSIIIIKNTAEGTVMVDREKITRLLVILLDNAIKYSNSGGQIMLDIKTTDKNLIIMVADEGVGIAKSDLPHIFDRFYRSDISRSKTQGYGLGLSIAKKIVKMHQGIIGAERKAGKGSVFSVIIPVSNRVES